MESSEAFQIYVVENVGMVFCYQNCSDLLWEKNCSRDREKLLKLEAEDLEFEQFLSSLFKTN